MKKITLIVLLILSLVSFYKINLLNYKKAKLIKNNIINHPDNLPTVEVAKNTSFGFKNLKADFYWLETIQYIWWNAISSKYKKYLYPILDIITELNPYFEHPYIIWELLLPAYNQNYEKLTEKEKSFYTEQAIKLWKKWIKNFCTATYKNKNIPETLKVELIKKEFDLKKIWNSKKYENPCKSYKIPDKLAYIYYFYKKDWLTASNYYKIASANKDSLKWAKIMAAIMQWKWWNRSKSFFMFITMADSENKKDPVCTAFSKYLVSFTKNFKLNLDTKDIKEIEKNRNKLLENWKKELNSIKEIWCYNFLNKATREMNLYYIEKAYKKYLADWNKEPISTPEDLIKKWYLDYSPKDYQRGEKHWIVYFYDSESKYFDYTMEYIN